MYETYGLLIGGHWRAKGGAGVIEVTDPATGEVIGAAPAASAADVEEAIAAAASGLKAWRATPAWTRADLLHSIANLMSARTEEAARRITLETGKPIAQARREWGLSIDQFRWHAEEARRIYGRIVESRAPGGRIEVSHEPAGFADPELSAADRLLAGQPQALEQEVGAVLHRLEHLGVGVTAHDVLDLVAT